jgi:hypothetical protein
MVNYLKGSLNDTDVIAAGSNAYSFWDSASPRSLPVTGGWDGMLARP